VPPPPAERARHATDSELARRIAVGDEAAFTQFYRSWFAPTLALARAISRRDESFSLDVVQDVMLNVVKKLPAVRDDIGVRAWMTRAVANVVTDRLRAEARRERRERTAHGERDQQTQEPWLRLVTDERHRWLVQSLAALPATDRELLAARFGSSSTVAAAATALGLSEDAAHGRLRRALARLRRQAGEWWHG
jgi:RNA polymerase sigma-70 factor (ECF subfamily)